MVGGLPSRQMIVTVPGVKLPGTNSVLPVGGFDVASCDLL